MLSIEELVAVVVEDTDLEGVAVGADTPLAALGLSSYAMMQLLMRVEDHFGCTLDDEDLAGVFSMSVAGLRDALERSSEAMA